LITSSSTRSIGKSPVGRYKAAPLPTIQTESQMPKSHESV
jgi:hypothetical protein